MSATETNLYGTHPSLKTDEPYESPEAYADQGDTRVIRNIQFSYLAHTGDNPDGTPVLTPVDIPRDTEVNVDDIGLIALKRGEKFHEFYTTKELEAIKRSGAPVEVNAEANLSDLGSFELSEWLATNDPDTGRPWTINAVLERVGDDKDLANRMLEAENVRSDGDPRDGLVKGLTAVIEAE